MPIYYENDPLPIDDIFKKSWKLYISTIKYVWLWSFLNSMLFLTSDYFEVTTITNLIHWKYFSFGINALLISTVFFLIWSFLRTALMVHMHYFALNRQKNFLKSITTSLKKLIPVTIASIIYEILTVASVFLFILPAIFLGILLFMYLPLIVFEKESIIQSFIKSAKLVYGTWWETFFIMVIPSGAIYLIRELIRRYFISHIPLLIFNILLLTLFLIPYSYALLLIQFNNLKIKKDLASISSVLKRRND